MPASSTDSSWEGSTRLKHLVRHGYLTKEYLEPWNPVHAGTFINGKSEHMPIPQNEVDRNLNDSQRPGW